MGGKKRLREIAIRVLRELEKKRLLSPKVEISILDKKDVISPLGWILYRLISMGQWDEVKRILCTKPGEIVIYKKDSEDLFEHPHVKLYHEYLFYVWSPEQTDISILLPCTGSKPYRGSVIHRTMLSYANSISRLGVSVEVYVISEPMLVVPMRYDKLYPFANYEFSPKNMEEYEKRKFSDLLARILPKIIINSKRVIAFMPNHHASILRRAISKIDNPRRIFIWPYGRLAFQSARRLYEHILSQILGEPRGSVKLQ